MSNLRIVKLSIRMFNKKERDKINNCEHNSH